MFKNVLFVGAHADDIELFAGATLASRVRQGLKSFCLTFSSHRGVTDHVQARAEHHASMTQLGVLYELQDFAACKGEFQQHRQVVYDAILARVTLHEIDCVISHWRGDTNQDHVTVAEEVIRACKSRCSILAGEYPFNTVSPFPATVFHPVSGSDVTAKANAISLYQSQAAPHRTYLEAGVWEGLARVRGAMIGSRYAEAFAAERVVI